MFLNKKNFINTLGFLLIVLAGCNKAANDKTTQLPKPPVDQNLLSLVPCNMETLAQVNLSALRKSKLWNSINAVLSSSINTGNLFPKMQTIEEINELVFAYKSNPEIAGKKNEADLLIITKGIFNAQKILDDMLLKKSASKIQINDRPGVKLDNNIAVKLTSRTLATGTRKMLIKMFAIIDGRAKSVLENKLMSRFNTSDKSAVKIYYHNKISPAGLDNHKNEINDFNYSNIKFASLYLAASNTADFNLEIETRTNLTSYELMESMKKTISGLRNNMFVVLMGFDWLFPKIIMSVKQATLNITLKLDEKDILNIDKLVQKIME